MSSGRAVDIYNTLVVASVETDSWQANKIGLTTFTRYLHVQQHSSAEEHRSGLSNLETGEDLTCRDMVI